MPLGAVPRKQLPKFFRPLLLISEVNPFFFPPDPSGTIAGRSIYPKRDIDPVVLAYD